MGRPPKRDFKQILVGITAKKKYTHLTHYLNSTEGDLKMAATRPLNGTPGPVTLSTVEVKESKQMEPFQ